MVMKEIYLPQAQVLRADVTRKLRVYWKHACTMIRITGRVCLNNGSALRPTGMVSDDVPAENSLGPEGAKRFLARTPNAAGKKTTSCRVGQEAAPDTDFGASTLVGKMPSQTGLTERAPQISFRKPPWVGKSRGLGNHARWPVSTIGSRTICAVRSCAGAMLIIFRSNPP